MKKNISYILSFLFTISGLFLLLGNFNVYSYFSLGDIRTIYTKNEGDAVSTQLNETEYISDPIRQGSHNIVKSYSGNSTTDGIVGKDVDINNHSTAVSNTLQIIKNIINWALGMLALVALIYIIIQGFIIITAVDDDAKQKKGFKGIKRACIAIMGIGLSWFIVTFIFWLIRGLTSSI